MNQKPDSKILTELMNAGGMFNSLHSDKKLGELLIQAIKTVPGILSCQICIKGLPEKIGSLQDDRCAECVIYKKEFASISENTCLFANEKGIVQIPLESSFKIRGFAVLKLTSPEMYEPYHPFVKNIANYAVIVMENRQHLINTEIIYRQLNDEVNTRDNIVAIIQLINRAQNTKELAKIVTGFIRNWLNIASVGIRLRKGEDYPYYDTIGFTKKFVKAENYLCARDKENRLIRDISGNPILKCMCGNIIRGRFDSSMPFFTENGSFWTNNASELLASTSQEDRQARTRNKFNSEGYESVVLIPLRTKDETFGLIQLNDFRKDRFTLKIISAIERIADRVAYVLALHLTKEALQESEQRYRSIIENIEDAYFRADKEGRIIMASPSAAKMYGYDSPEDMIGISALSFYRFPERRQGMLDELKKYGRVYDYVGEGLKKDGTLLWVSLNAHFIYDTKGEIVGTEAFVRDITDRKQTEDEIKRQQSELMEKTISLEESNTALKVLINRIEGDKYEIKQSILRNLKESVFPYIEKMKSGVSDHKRKILIERVEAGLSDLASPFLNRLSSLNLTLTSQEIRIAALIKDNKSNKEIADIMNISLTTVNFHRRNLRKKLNLRNTDANLRVYLLSLTQAG